MISEDRIIDIISRLTEWGTKYKERDKKTHYFNDAHRFGSELRERLSYHAEYDKFPEELINSAAPNESKEEYDYRRANYKQVTKPYWDKALSSTYRIFNPQNYSIEWKDEAQEYFTLEYPVFGNYIQWFIDVVHPMKFADPNAVLAVCPDYIPVKVEGEEIKVDQAKEIDPITKIYSADKVFEYLREYVLVLTEEKSIVKYRNKDVEEGLIFELYDDTNIYRITQFGDKADYNFEWEIFYPHNWEQIPAWKLKGIISYDPKEIIYFSHFQCAVPNLDEAAFLNNTSFAVTNRIAFPTNWYYRSKCKSCEGVGYIESYENDILTRKACQSCKGSGKNSLSWGKDIIIDIPDNITDPDVSQIPSPPIGSHSPDVKTIEYLDQKVEKKCETSFLNLQIDVSNKPDSPTATEVKIDREEFISFLIKITKEEFYLMQESINAQSFMRWQKEDLVKINEPNEYTMRSSEALTEEMKTARDSKVPAPYSFKLLQESIKQRFNNDPVMERIIEVVKVVDPMMMMDEGTISQRISMAVVDKWRGTLHDFIYNFIYSELDKNEKFLEQEIETIQPILEQKAKDMTVKTTTKAEDILSQI